MKVACVYCFPTVDPGKYVPAAKKFVSSYLEHPAGAEHELHVVVNDGKPSHEGVTHIFEPLSPIFHWADNWCKDLGAFMHAAQIIKCDLLVCMGAHVSFWKPNWLDVITRSYAAIGPAVYGTWGFQEPTPHLRTTFFWTAPEILASYPHLESESDRYGMEHGTSNIALWSRKNGFEPYQVTWAGAYSMKFWHAITLQEALARDQHSMRDFGE